MITFLPFPNEQLQAFGLKIKEIEPQIKLEVETLKKETK